MFKSTACNEWHQSLGQKVCVRENTYGTLRYFGETYFAEGLWCGIELDEAVGENDGKVDDIRYFTCEQNFGLFVPVSETSLMNRNSNVNGYSKFSLFNQIKSIKKFHSHSEIQKGILNPGIVNNNQLNSYDKSPPKNALNESYTISSDLPDKNTLSVIAEESAQILDISSFNFSQLRHVSGLDKSDDIECTSCDNVLSRTFSAAVSSNQLKEVPNQNIKENYQNFLESDGSLGILPSYLLEDLSSDDLLYHSETPYGNHKSIINLPDDMSKELNNRFEEIISNTPASIDLDETFHPILHAANSFLCAQNYESPLLQNNTSLPKFASTPKHETNFSDVSDEIEKALNLTHDLSPDSHAYHNALETPNKGVENIESVSKAGTYGGETHLSITQVNKSIKDSNVQCIDGVTEGMNYTNPSMKTINDLNATQCMESIASDFKHSNNFIDLNTTQCVESTSKDLNVTHCANYIEISKKDIDLNVNQRMENNSEDFKYMSLNESIEDANVTQCIKGISEDVKYNKSLDESIKDLNVTQCIEGISEDLKNESFNKNIKDLNITQSIEGISENLKNNESFNNHNKDLNVMQSIESISNVIDLNVTQCLENGTENLLNLTLTYPNELDHGSEECCSEDGTKKEYSFKIQKDLILHEKTSQVLNIPHENNLKLHELNADFESLLSLKLPKVTTKENKKSLKSVSKNTGRKSEFYAKSDTFSSESKIKFERHKIRKSVSCFANMNELKTGMYEKQVRRKSLSGNVSSSSTGDILEAKASPSSKKLSFRYSSKQTSHISNPSKKVTYQGKLITSQENTVSSRSGIKTINRNNLRHSTLKSELSNFKVDKKEAKQSTLIEPEDKKGCLEETVHLTNQINEVENAVIRNTISGIQNLKNNNCSHSTLKFNPSNCKKQATQSIQVESEDNKDCLLNETVFLDDKIDDVGKTVIKKSRSSLNFSSIKKTEQNNILYRNNGDLLNEIKHLHCETNEVGKTVIKIPKNSMKFSSIQSSSSVHKSIPYRNTEERLNEVNHLDCQIGEVRKTITKKPRSSMKFSSIQSSSSVHNSIPYRNKENLSEVNNLNCQIDKLGKTVTKKPRSSMKFSSIQSSPSVHNSIPYRNKESLNEVNYLDCQIDEVEKTVTKKPRSSTNFSNMEKTSDYNSILCRSTEENLLNEGKHFNYQISEVGKTIIKKPRNSINFTNITKTSSEHSGTPSRNKMTCDKNKLPTKCEDYLNKVTKKPSIGSALNVKPNKIARIHKHSFSEKPKSDVLSCNNIGGNKSLLALCDTTGKGANYKSIPRKSLKQVSMEQNLNHNVLLSNQESSSTQRIEDFKSTCIPKRGAEISTSGTSLNEVCKLDKRTVSNVSALPNQETSCKQSAEGKFCHLSNLRKTGSSISRIKPPSKYCSR